MRVRYLTWFYFNRNVIQNFIVEREWRTLKMEQHRVDLNGKIRRPKSKNSEAFGIVWDGSSTHHRSSIKRRHRSAESQIVWNVSNPGAIGTTAGEHGVFRAARNSKNPATDCCVSGALLPSLSKGLLGRAQRILSRVRIRPWGISGGTKRMKRRCKRRRRGCRQKGR